MSRNYPVPARVTATVDGDGPLAGRVRAGEALSTEDLNRAAFVAAGTPLGDWANQIMRNEQAAALDALLPDDRLPRGVLASGTDDDIVVALALNGQVFTASGWAEGEVDDQYLMELDEETIVAVADALSSGADGVVLRSWVPLAFIAAAPAPAAKAKPKTPPRPSQDVSPEEPKPKQSAAPTAKQAAEGTDDPQNADAEAPKVEADQAAAAPGTPDVPEGAKPVAVVDDLDKTAVIDLLAIAPGPKVFRRNDGGWAEDAKWMNALRSVSPPPLVQLTDPGQIANVIAQVDEATKGMPFDVDAEKKPEGDGGEAPADGATPSEEPAAPKADEADPKAAEDEDKKPKDPVAASAAWADEHQRKADEFATQLALVAAGKGASSLKGKAAGAAGAEKLRQYWLKGEGALKIRWGTPGDWKRCYRQLSKHLGPRAAGYCQLMHGRATGTWAGRNHSGVPSPKVKAEAIAKQHVR